MFFLDNDHFFGFRAFFGFYQMLSILFTFQWSWKGDLALKTSYSSLLDSFRMLCKIKTIVGNQPSLQTLQTGD